jgi:hypothetical protein
MRKPSIGRSSVLRAVKEHSMSIQAVTYRVLIASPSDMADERQAANEAINEWNAQHAASEAIVLLPSRWETHASPQIGLR